MNQQSCVKKVILNAYRSLYISHLGRFVPNDSNLDSWRFVVAKKSALINPHATSTGRAVALFSCTTEVACDDFAVISVHDAACCMLNTCKYIQVMNTTELSCTRLPVGFRFNFTLVFGRRDNRSPHSSPEATFSSTLEGAPSKNVRL